MGQIKIYSNLSTGKISFDGAKLGQKDIGSIEATAHPTQRNRVIVKSTVLFKSGSTTEHRVFFKRLKITRVQNEAGETLVDAPYSYNRDQILAYLNNEFARPTIGEYFEYNPSTDRLKAVKAIETTLSSLHLGGQHRMSSGAANVYFDDLTRETSDFPVFGRMLDQSLPENQAAGAGLVNPSTRLFGDFSTVGLGGTPVNDTAIAYDGDNFFPFNISGVGITTRVAEAVPANQRLLYELSVDGTLVYQQYLDHSGLSVNEDLTWFFTHPLDIEAGSTNHASITKVETVGNQETRQGLLLVCEGDDVNTRYQTNVLHRLFEDKEIATKDDVNALSTGSIYKGTYNADTDTPSLPTGSDVLGDFYRVATPGNGKAVGDVMVFNGTDYDHIAADSVTQNDINSSGLRVYDVMVKAGYTGNVSDGSALYPFGDVVTAVASANDGDTIFLDGVFNVTSSVVLPADKSLTFVGSDGSAIQYASYDASNGNVLEVTGTDNSKEYAFRNLRFSNAGGYGILTKKTAKVEIENCDFTNNGWNGSALNTILPETATALLGYDSSSADLQAFYAGSNASDGGALKVEESTGVRVIGNNVSKNLRGIKLQDCGIGGYGFVTRNVSSQNIESGIYLAAGTLQGCHNVTVSMNASSYNANTGLLVIGGINNKFSQNEVNGNWKAGFHAWGSANTTLRDCGLYDNNRAQFNGIGNSGDTKASIQINEQANYLGTAISANADFRFIAEILDTQVHYTGLGSDSEKVGLFIDATVGQLADNDKNIIKVDDVGFIGQDYAIDLSEVDVTNLRLSLGDNSYQSIGTKAINPPLAGNYSELPFSNHVMQVPTVDVVVDTLKQSITLNEGVGGNVINRYAINELTSTVVGSTIQISQNNSDKVQLRGLTVGNIYVNGTLAGNDLNSANDTLNAAFQMDLVNYKSFLVSEVGINDESSLPAISNNWFVSYGAEAGTQITTPTIGNTWRNYNPFYNGEPLEKGHEFVWTHNPSYGYIVGVWGAAETPQAGSDALQPSNWTVGFAYAGTNTRFSQIDSSGVTIETSGSFNGYYGMPNGQLALRFGQDNYLYLYEIVNGGYSLIGKSNSTIAGSSVTIQWSSFNEGSFPVFTERTESWEIVHDQDNSQGGEWSNGLEESTVIKSRISVSPGEKITLNFNYFGRSEKIGFGYNGAASNVASAEDTLEDGFFYNTSEIIKEIGASESNWTWNTSALNSYDPNGDRSDIGYDSSIHAGNNNLGLISFRYNSDNSLEMWHETNNELIATKKVDLDGSAFNIFLGANENSHTADRIPELVKYDMSAEEEGASLTGWYYIESPDGEFYYPLSASEAEANYIDSIEDGGSGTSHPHTFADDTYNGGSNTWYMPDTSGVHAGSEAPQGGIFGNSINVVWNEIPTGEDANYLPTFSNITYNVQEGSAINIQYKAAGMTDTFNVTNVPNGYADNGFAIIGTAEDITNGAGNSITHVINVTKANPFGSVQGTITINVLADLAGNEFTIVEQASGIKFTQDGGSTILDFNTVTFNAGSTYKFYLDHGSVESNDTLMVVDANGNAYTTGVTLNGTVGSAGAYLEFVVPADVPPISLVWTDGDGAATATVPMTVAGSTYSANPTGIDLEGPSANQTGSNVMDSGDHGWISLDETLGAGERLVLDNAFFTDFIGEVKSNNTIFAIGLKGSNWSNTKQVNSNGAAASGLTFAGNSYIVGIFNSSGTSLTMYPVANGIVGNSMYLNTTSLMNTTCAFLEVTNSGNNIRLAFGRNGNLGITSGDESTVTYGNWNAYKGQSGDNSGYASVTTPLDVVMSFWTFNGNAIDGNEIDWTGLSEISVPAPPTTNATNWTKAIDFSGGNEHLKQVSSNSDYNPLRMNGTSVTVGLPDQAGSTVRAVNGRPWATSIVFKSDGNNSNQHIWNTGEGTATGNDNIFLRVTAAGTLIFAWGREGSGYNECTIATNISPSTWYGVYIASTGARFNSADATASNLANAFDIRLMSSADSFAAVGSNLSTSSNWTSTGARMDRSVTGDFTIGGRGSNRNFHGKIASMVVTNLRITEYSNTQIAMPSDAEVKLMITDPKGWEDDYRDGELVRAYDGVTTGTYSPTNYVYGYLSNMIYLMGDGGSDSYANGIRNELRPSDQNYTKLQFNSMASNDIENVTIPNLS
jgi:hypothetical protein